MITADRGLTAYTDRYLMARSVSSDYAKTLRARIAAFTDWAGADVPVECLTCEMANEWLAELAECGMSAWSLRGYRQALLAVWGAAFQTGDNHNPPLRVRLVRPPRLVVEAYTHGEIAKLLRCAEGLAAIHADGNRASDFWLAAIHVAYSCGPRRGDLLAVKRTHVSPDGVLSFVQSKTKYPHRVQLSSQAILYCSRLKSDAGYLLAWPYTADWFTRTFRRLRDSAGVTRGSFKWIRRSAGSYAEKQQPGAGARLLGHRDASVFIRFYNDATISGELPISPPPL
jgi:integrase